MQGLTGQTLGPYELQDVLGRGGMGVVYRAVHRTLGRARAVKVLPPQLALDDSFVERFRREATIAAGLRHPNIVLIYDIAEQDGLHYIVMDLVEGSSLRDLNERESPLPMSRALHILRQLAEALDYAHAQGVLHRDVKPANVLIGTGDHVTLVDFGIARAAEGTRLTEAGAMVGTASYMAPEVVTGRGGGQSADLYALGVVAFELLTGFVPFRGPDTTSIMYAHVHTPPPPARSLRPDVPEGVDRALQRQLAKDPNARYPSAGAFVSALVAGVQDVRAADGPLNLGDAGAKAPPSPVDRSAGRRQPAPTDPMVPGDPWRQPDPSLGQRRQRDQAGGGGTIPPPPRRDTTVPMPVQPGGDRRGLALVLAGPIVAVLALILVGAFLLLYQFKIGPFAPAQPTPTAVVIAPTSPPTPVPTAVPPTAVPTTTAVPPTPTAGPGERLQLARDARSAGDFARAISLLQALKQSDPTTPGLDDELYQTYIAYGKALLDRNDFEGALTQYTEALRVRPNDQAAIAGQRQAQLGRQWARMEAAWSTNEDEAIAALEEILRIDPSYRDARQKLYAKLIGKADRLISAGDRAGALPLLQRALQINPDAPEARQRLATYTPAANAVLFSDNFDDPVGGRMPKQSGAPNDYTLAYVGGEYQVRVINPNINYLPTIYAPGSYADATLVVDARIVGDVQNRYISIGCRRGSDQPTGYRLLVDPTTAQVRLTRVDDANITPLVDWQVAPAVRRGNERNRLELTCAGSTISASVNGVQVMSAQDGRYRDGMILIGASNFTGSTGQVDARFDNLSIIRR